MTHQTSGTLLTKEIIAPPAPANGGLVLTITRDSPRVKIPQAID